VSDYREVLNLAQGVVATRLMFRFAARIPARSAAPYGRDSAQPNPAHFAAGLLTLD